MQIRIAISGEDLWTLWVGRQGRRYAQVRLALPEVPEDEREAMAADMQEIGRDMYSAIRKMNGQHAAHQ